MWGTYLSEDFLFYCYWAEKGSIHSVLRHCRLAKSNQFLHTHTYTERVVLFFRLRPLLSLTFMFICFSCTRVLLSLLSLCLYFHDRAERRPSRVNFIWTSQWICVNVCLNHSDVCFHLKSVSLSFHFRSEILNVPGFKKKKNILSIKSPPEPWFQSNL